MASWLPAVAVATLAIVAFAVLTPLAVLAYLYVFDRRQRQHSVLRNYPLLGKLRYFLEAIGPELRQYFFDADHEGKPFDRVDFQTIVRAGKYATTLIGYGSKRDFEAPGYYLRNALFPLEIEELRADNSEPVSTWKYESREFLFSRRERFVETKLDPWLLLPEDAVVVGPRCREPWRLRGQVGCSGMSFGALGANAIRAISLGLAQVGGSWMNTGEGGLSPYHLAGGVDIVAQIGPGLFGYRNRDGSFSWDELRKKAEIPAVRAFELKTAQGAKIRGGHLPGPKVTPEIAAIRLLEPWKSVDSPNRFREFHDVPSMCDFIERIREATGKPVGVKVVVGGPDALDELARYMAESGTGPDFITVDGGEGGSGATYAEMADSMGLPVKTAIVFADDSLRRYGVRERVTLVASGKLFSPDRIAVALALGADLVQIARGMMISVGCIGTQRCHLNTCPVGVATTDPRLQRALVVEEKRWRVTNYVATLRHGLFTLAAAAGLPSPRHFRREHVMYQDARGLTRPVSEIHPYPEPLAAGRTKRRRAGAGA